MTLRRRPVLSSLLLLGALSTCACDGNGSTSALNSVGPSPLRPTEGFVNAARGPLVQPAFIAPVFRHGAVCPAFPPLLAPFTVIFQGDSRSDRFFSQLHVEFVDRFGVAGGLLTLGRTELASRFGSTTIPAFGRRTFPFSFPFGCVGAPTGMLTVVIFAADPFGHVTSSRVQVVIR